MSLKARIANKIETDNEGMTVGTIISVLDNPENYKDSKDRVVTKKEFDDLKEQGKKPVKYVAQFEFHIEIEGSQSSVIRNIWTGQTINDLKTEKDNGQKDYNNLTRLLLQLELITEKDLEDLDSLVDFNVEQVQGLKIQFEFESHKKNKNMPVIKLTSIKPLKVAD